MDKLTRSRFMELAAAKEEVIEAVEKARECMQRLNDIENELVHDINMKWMDWFFADDQEIEDLPTYISTLKRGESISIEGYMFSPTRPPEHDEIINLMVDIAPLVIEEVEQ